MSIITVDDIHIVPDPEKRLQRAAHLAAVNAGTDTHRIIVRVPDRASDGIRAVRLDDVARMLQRHGRIRELATTDNGTIVAAADICRRRGEIAIWTGYAIGPWHPSDILQRGLGGSETAAVRLAEQFAAMGYIVTLYGQFSQPGMVGDVMLRDFQTFDPSEPLDALIGFRDASLFDRRPRARFTALWLEDLAPAERLTPARAQNIDRIYSVSHWHKQQVQDEHPWLDPQKVSASRNGIVHRFFGGDAPVRENRVIYSSSPDRGADVILDVWPDVRAQVPDAELVLTYSRWYDMVAEVFTQAQDHRRRMYELLEQPGVRRLEGGLGQMALAHLMRTCKVWAHPSWYSAGRNPDGQPGGTEFHETSCISAMEAQAAGCVAVASNWGALSETVMHGTLVDGDPRDRDGAWRKQFVDAIVQGLTDDVTQQAAQVVGPELMAGMDWRGAAEQVAALIPDQRQPGRPGSRDNPILVHTTRTAR